MGGDTLAPRVSDLERIAHLHLSVLQESGKETVSVVCIYHSRAVVPLPPALALCCVRRAYRSPYEERVLSETRLLWSAHFKGGQWISYVTPTCCQAIAKVSFKFSHTSNSGIMGDLCPEVKGWTLNAT